MIHSRLEEQKPRPLGASDKFRLAWLLGIPSQRVVQEEANRYQTGKPRKHPVNDFCASGTFAALGLIRLLTPWAASYIVTDVARISIRIFIDCRSKQ
jgi:hypothetical protein